MGCFSEDFLFFASKAADSVFVDLFEYPVDLGGKLLLALYFLLPDAGAWFEVKTVPDLRPGDIERSCGHTSQVSGFTASVGTFGEYNHAVENSETDSGETY